MMGEKQPETVLEAMEQIALGQLVDNLLADKDRSGPGSEQAFDDLDRSLDTGTERPWRRE